MSKMTMLLVLIIFSLNVETMALAVEKSKSTKESMSNFLDQFLGLKKYLVSDDAFQDPRNATAISSHLQALSKAVKETSHDPILNQENFKFSREALQDHVFEADRVFRLGNKSYARWMTNSTLGLCMSCHTQMPTQDRKFAIFARADFFTSQFDQAEFLFATKNFEGASNSYRNMVAEYPKDGLTFDRIEMSIQREISYRLKVKRDFKEARASIAEFRKNKKLPESLLQNLTAWDEQIAVWQKRKLPDIAIAKPDQVIQFAEMNLAIDANRTKTETNEPRFIENLVVSSVLYEYLQKKPHSPATPEVLYWLAIIDRSMSNSIFYSLADLYLKECMMKFPASKAAMKCYKEYELEMVLGYSGSAGTNIPSEVSDELKRLKSYVEAKGKVPLQRRIP